MTDVKSVNNGFKNGENIQFDYNNANITNPVEPNGHVSSKKKKKKKKNKKVDVEATLNNPHDDYPTSRVIKQAPDGSVIVESIEEEVEQNPVTDIWFHDLTIDERKDLSKFWESLPGKDKSKLAKIEKDELLTILRAEPKTKPPQPHSQLNNSNCNCSHCGRKRNMIFNEIERMYDDYEDDIYEFINQVIDLKDLSKLPHHLFKDFNQLPKAMKPINPRVQLPPPIVPPNSASSNNPNITNGSSVGSSMGSSNGSSNGPSMSKSMAPPLLSQISRQISSNSLNKLQIDQLDQQLQHHHQQEIINDIRNQPPTAQSILQESKLLDQKIDFGKLDLDMFNNPSIDKQELLNKVFDQKLHDALRSLDLEKFKSLTRENQASAIEEVGELKEFMNSLRTADKSEIKKSIDFIEHMAKMFDINLHDPKDVANAASIFNHLEGDNQMKNGLNNLTDDIIQSNGQHFIKMMENLSKSRNSRETLLEMTDDKPSIVEESPVYEESDNENYDIEEYNSEDELVDEGELIDGEDFENHYHSHYHDSENDYEDDEEDEEEEDDDDYEDYENVGNEYIKENEISEEDKLKELRQLFLMQVMRVFRQRLKSAYKEKLSQDRTQRLIEELEAEENAKKQKEVKKLKQKEKAKEKKKAQQLAREEEKKRKEEEEKARKEEEKRKTEKLQAEQRKRNEEYQRKKEEEKLRIIEEQKRKMELKKAEELKKKQAEEQRKAEQLKKAEQKKLEDERKAELMKVEQKKAEEQKQKLLERQKEELKIKESEAQAKQKELENERLLKEKSEKEREIAEAEALLKEQEAAAARFKEESSNDTVPLNNPLYNISGNNTSNSTPKLDNSHWPSSPFNQPQNQNFRPFNNGFSFNDPFNTTGGLSYGVTNGLSGSLNQPSVNGSLSGSMNGSMNGSLNNVSLNNGSLNNNSLNNGSLNNNSLNGTSMSGPSIGGSLSGPSNTLNNGLNNGLNGPNGNGNVNGELNNMLNNNLMSNVPPGLSPSLQRLSTTSLNTWSETPNLMKLNSNFSSFSGSYNNYGSMIWNDQNQPDQSNLSQNLSQTNLSQNLTQPNMPSNLSQNLSQNLPQNLPQNLQTLPQTLPQQLPNQPPDQIVLNAVYKAYHTLANANQIWNGYAKISTLYQATINILPQYQLDYSHFITIISNQLAISNYKFEFLYDNYQISHIKIGSDQISPMLNNRFNQFPVNLSNDMINFNHQL